MIKSRGQYIGDALGLGTEVMDDEAMARKYPNGLTHYSDIFQDRHRRRWKKGDWTDETSKFAEECDAVAFFCKLRVSFVIFKTKRGGPEILSIT